eukprot:gene1080-2640_t
MWTTAFMTFASAVVAFGMCPGAANTKPIWQEPPKPVRTVKNGRRFAAGADGQLSVVHLYGTPYEMGY